MITPITKALQWLWKWQKNSGEKFSRPGVESTRYLGVKEKGMVGDVKNFLQEIRMQDRLPDILRQRNISVEEFKRLEELNQLYHRSRGGDAEAQRILTERFGNDPDGSLHLDAMMEEYDGVKEEMHTQGENFVLDPIYISPELDIPDLPDEPTYPPDSPVAPVAPPPEVDPREELGREFLDRLGRNFESDRLDPMSWLEGDADEIRFNRRMNRENPMGQEEIDSIMRERRRLGLPPYGGEGE